MKLDGGMVREFFYTARERERIRRARDAGKPAPWTRDPILSSFRFTNVRREDDKVTRWFADNLRGPLQDDPLRVVLATVVFRTFNLVATGEKLRPMLLEGKWNSREARSLIGNQQPIITGAYIVRTPNGMDKLTGVLTILDGFFETGTMPIVAEANTLKWAHAKLVRVPYFGYFTSYEVVSDLRWTCVLRNAPDIMTWANPGPGCLAGMSYIIGRELRQCRRDREECLHLMQKLLARSRAKSNWPAEWPAWEMREVEHWLCEFSKYQHAKEGKRLKRRYP